MLHLVGQLLIQIYYLFNDHRIENFRKTCVQNKMKIGKLSGETVQSLDEEGEEAM